MLKLHVATLLGTRLLLFKAQTQLVKIIMVMVRGNIGIKESAEMQSQNISAIVWCGLLSIPTLVLHLKFLIWLWTIDYHKENES